MVKIHLSVIYNVLKLNNSLRVSKPVILVKITMVCYVHIFILNNAVITIDSTIFFMLSSSQLPRLFWCRPTKYKENVKVYYHYNHNCPYCVLIFSMRIPFASEQSGPELPLAHIWQIYRRYELHNTWSYQNPVASDILMQSLLISWSCSSEWRALR